MQTFSELTKEELYKDEHSGSCCDLAELAGMLLLGSSISDDGIRLVTENGDVLARLCDLCAKLGIDFGFDVQKSLPAFFSNNLGQGLTFSRDDNVVTVYKTVAYVFRKLEPQRRLARTGHSDQNYVVLFHLSPSPQTHVLSLPKYLRPQAPTPLP